MKAIQYHLGIILESINSLNLKQNNFASLDEFVSFIHEQKVAAFNSLTSIELNAIINFSNAKLISQSDSGNEEFFNKSKTIEDFPSYFKEVENVISNINEGFKDDRIEKFNENRNSKLEHLYSEITPDLINERNEFREMGSKAILTDKDREAIYKKNNNN